MLTGLKGGRYRPLSKDAIGRIHEKALKILEIVGVKVELPEALAIFEGAKTKVDRQSLNVKIPPKTVESMLQRAPSTVSLHARSPKNNLTLKKHRVHMGTGGAALNVIDLATGEKREGTLKDVANFARLADKMDNIHFYIRPCTARDREQKNLGPDEFFAALSNTEKHVMGNAYTVEEVGRIVDMAELIAGGKEKLKKNPCISFIVAWMKSPLTFDSCRTAVLMEIVRRKIPVALSSAPMAGSTSPVTMAGTLCQLHAEELAGIVFSQIIRPGAPVLYGGIPGVADMQDLSYKGGGVEFGLMNAAISQLATYINVPNYCSAGITEAHVPSFQAMYEKTFSVSQCALAGANYVHHAAGVLESIKTVDYGQMVIDNEIIGMALKMVAGIEVNEETLAFDEIERCGPGGNFIEFDHTLSHMRTEYRESDLTGKKTPGSSGKKLSTYIDLLEESRKRAAKIICSPNNAELPAKLTSEIKNKCKIRSQ